MKARATVRERPVITDMTFAVQSERCPYTIRGERRPCQLIVMQNEETDGVCVVLPGRGRCQGSQGVTHRLFDHERELYEDSGYLVASREARGYYYVLNVDKKNFTAKVAITAEPPARLRLLCFASSTLRS